MFHQCRSYSEDHRYRGIHLRKWGGVACIALLAVLPLFPWSPVRAQEPPSSSVDNPCNPLEGQCDPPSGGAVQPLERTSDVLDHMGNDLVLNWFQPGLCAQVESGVPEITDYGDLLEAYQAVTLHHDGEEFGHGTLTVLTNPDTGIVDLEMVVADGLIGAGLVLDGEAAGGVNVQWTLRQTIWTGSNGEVYSLGTLEKVREQPPEAVSYVGGWVYDPQTGPLEHPDSEAGFHAEVSAMFGCDATVAGFGIGNALSLVGNLIAMGLHYFRDLFIPWSTPTSCSGPIIEDGIGQSCRNVNIPCKSSIADLAKKIGSLPGVSRAFKKCLKGRLGCGGSSFPRSRVRCGNQNACGPCGSAPLGFIIGGCNIAGSLVWYCDQAANRCECIEIVFHEVSHSCGAMDLDNGSAYDAYRIGDWFESQFIQLYGSCSTPSASPSSSDDGIIVSSVD